MASPKSFAPFVVSPHDPLAKEHQVVATWVEEALNTLGEHSYYKDLELKAIPSGEAILTNNPEQARRYVLAAVAQVSYWDKQCALVRAQGENELQRINAHHLPGWSQVRGREIQASTVIKALMRRNLPFDQTDFLVILKWCCECESLSTYTTPIGSIVRALQRFAEENTVDVKLREALTQFATRLRALYDKDAKRFGTVVEQICGKGEQESETASDMVILPVPQPAPAGSPQVLHWLKRTLGMLPSEPVPTTTILEPDRFALRDDSPLRHEHELLTSLFNAVIGTPHYYQADLHAFDEGRTLLAQKPEAMGKVLLAAAERYVNTFLPAGSDVSAPAVWQSRYAAISAAMTLLKCDYKVDRKEAFDLLLFLSVLPNHQRTESAEAMTSLITATRQNDKQSPLTEGERFVLYLFRASLITGPALGAPSEEAKSLTRLIQDGAAFYLVPGEAWAEAVNQDIPRCKSPKRAAWTELFRHVLSATTSRPSAKWLKTSAQHIKAIGEASFVDSLQKWFLLVSKGQTIRKFSAYIGDTRSGSDTMHEENATALRGLLWCVPLLKQRDNLAHAVTSVALSAYKKVPGIGPRAVKVGNAAVYVLSTLGSKEAVGQLAMLKVRVKFGTAQKEIEKAFDTAAKALALPRDQIEELGVPSYGLEEVGKLSEFLGGYRAELNVTGSDAALTWFDEKGKQLKSVPAKVKSEHKDELKDLQQSLKDIQAMLPAQRDRIDGLFLLQKSWPIVEWRERYHDHPLVGTIARRLLWCIDGTSAFFIDGIPTDVTGKAIEHGKTAEITLWHPVGRAIEEITGWRRRLEELRITQPFKQAYREVYLLTDAERNTRTYSNRYAAHIIRQHQFNALCAARGWKNALRLMVDASYNPPTKLLPQWGLRAEFWIEGIGDNYGTDTNDAGTFLRLATDQVRFYRTQAAENYAHAGGGRYESGAAGPGNDNINEPLPLDQVPALAFSEIMRDVDLFVGVASVGNDPTWQDGGPEGRYATYWQNYSFGELSGTATTRRQVLERLVPRLKIAKRCSLSDRFLIVRGDKRTYKIHLGSGNILMEPNDQYLCIVPDARARASQDDLYLPFEGDSTLSIIISKALLLADDTKIKDPTITRQIEHK